jgi:hypothetical protein
MPLPVISSRNITDMKLSPAACVSTQRLQRLVAAIRFATNKAELPASICRVVQPLLEHAACIHIANPGRPPHSMPGTLAGDWNRLPHAPFSSLLI